MADVTVTPEKFVMVFYDGGRIAELVGEVADRIGLDAPVRVDVDEASIQGKVRLVAFDPVTVAVAGGAFEDAKKPRQLSDNDVRDVAGRMLLRAKDRLDPAFGTPPPEDELTLAQATAWTVYALGRFERLGYRPAKPRWHYHFRNRHGFTDVADAAFERLWNAEGLTWADIDAACAETAAAREPAA